jgi:uncharacterized Zn finger protein
MELMDVIKKASEGTLRCPKCGSEGVSLQNVRVGMKDGKPFMDPSAYGSCKKCSAKLSIEKLQNKGDDVAGKQWWQFWK